MKLYRVFSAACSTDWQWNNCIHSALVSRDLRGSTLWAQSLPKHYAYVNPVRKWECAVLPNEVLIPSRSWAGGWSLVTLHVDLRSLQQPVQFYRRSQSTDRHHCSLTDGGTMGGILGTPSAFHTRPCRSTPVKRTVVWRPPRGAACDRPGVQTHRPSKTLPFISPASREAVRPQ